MINLSLNETRVLGVLFEKERTTPDQYPLSLNALTTGCNQKSNREPVLSLDESIVQEVVDSLIEKGLVAEVTLGGRVTKYRQRFANTQFSEFNLSLQEQSILSVLFLRGPQTPGELRTRTSRLCEFSDVQEVEHVLQNLMERPADAFVMKLAREPGKRESRYAHLFSGEVLVHDIAENTHVPPIVPAISADLEKQYEDRISALEQQLETMQVEIDTLKRLWDDLNS